MFKQFSILTAHINLATIAKIKYLITAYDYNDCYMQKLHVVSCDLTELIVPRLPLQPDANQAACFHANVVAFFFHSAPATHAELLLQRH